MTVAPSHTTIKTSTLDTRLLSQPLYSLYRKLAESNLLYAPCSVFFVFIFVLLKAHFFVFLSPLLGTESQKCVTACSTGTVA